MTNSPAVEPRLLFESDSILFPVYDPLRPLHRAGDARSKKPRIPLKGLEDLFLPAFEVLVRRAVNLNDVAFANLPTRFECSNFLAVAAVMKLGCEFLALLLSHSSDSNNVSVNVKHGLNFVCESFHGIPFSQKNYWRRLTHPLQDATAFR